MRPGNVKDLSADLLNALDKEGKFLMNLGLEIAPYWLKSRPNLTKKQFLQPNPGQTFLQTFLLSAATVKDSASGKNKLGTGFRFKLFNGYATNEYLQKQKELQFILNINSAIAAAKAFIGISINSRIDAIEFIANILKETGHNEEVIKDFRILAIKHAANFDDSKSGINLYIEDLNNTVDRNNFDLKKKVAELSRKRIGFILEVAGASGFATSSSKNAFERAGVWITAAYVVSEMDACNFSLRYLFSNKDSAVSSFDAGSSYVKELSKFSLSIEGMLRWYRAEFPDFNNIGQAITKVDKDFTYRLAIQSAYKISNDISVNISLGKDFDTPFVTGSGFFSILGINYSILNKAKVSLSPESTE